MTFRNTIAVILLLVLCFVSCKNDDDGFTQVPARDRTVQQEADKDSLLKYMSTHYYNSSLFETSGNYTYDDIVILELPDENEDGIYDDLPDPANNTLLIDDIETFTTEYRDVEYEYYTLKLNQGGGDSPYSSDTVNINYFGNLFDGEDFDSTVNATSLDLITLIEAWRVVLPGFGTATTIIDNGDGTFSYDTYGLGVMFVPSGLAYFSAPPFGIPQYANLIFKFELYTSEFNDHDADLVMSFLEDINQDGNVFDDDTDNDDIPNFFDVDDDGDGVLTRFEVIRNEYEENENTMTPFMSRVEAQEYYDNVIAVNVEDEIFVSIESKPGGTFILNTLTVPDFDNDGIPNYLDSGTAISNQDDN